jgi:hypothetical protein
MSFKRTLHNLHSISSELDRLLSNLENALKNIRPRTNVKNTRIGKIRRDLEKISDLEIPKATKLLEVAIKLNQINFIFDHGINFKSDDIIRLIEGKYDLSNDDAVTSHDYLFEFITGVRFAIVHEGSHEVSLSGGGDVKIGQDFAVECKNIRSLNSLVKNIDTGRRQVDERVASGEVTFGFIALDLSNIFPTEKAEKFIQQTYEIFYKNHLKIKEAQRSDREIIDTVLDDKNFQKIVNSYIMHETEAALYSALKLTYDMGVNTVAIIYQVHRCFLIEGDEENTLLPIRGMSYFLNNKLTEEAQEKVATYLHRLAVGF